MCGFVALFEADRRFPSSLLGAMERDIRHRGPDSGGITDAPGLALVFRRLAILDPGPASDQPMTDPSGRYTIVFNGEIYNFRDLRRALADAGVGLRTQGDTEVILRGWATWGEAVLDRLEGMYAFVIVDRVERKAYAARDPFGIKPMYLMRRGGLVALASEMRPLARLAAPEPDPRALAELVSYRWAAGRLSNLKGIDRVPGGTLVTVSLADVRVRERRFCDPLDSMAPDPDIGAEAAEAMARDAVEASVRCHLESDVGYALQLSGGVDSSLVTAMVRAHTSGRLTTYGVRLDDPRFDEGRYRRMVTERHRLDHHEVPLNGHDYADALPRAVRHMEGPCPHLACVLLMPLCDRIRESHKVVLTGEGADEMFGGYMRYGLWRDLRRKTWAARLVPAAAWPYLRRYREIQRYAGRDGAIVGAIQHDDLALFDMFPGLIPEPGAREAAAARGGRDFRSRMLAVDQATYLESLLMRQDKMAMAASVEARVPFTHLPLARVVNRLPHRLRLPGGETKPLLKRIAAPYLPAALLNRRKVGFTLPLDDWLADAEGLGRYLDDLTASDGRLAAYTERRRLKAAVDAFRAGRRHGLPPLAHLINLETWLRGLTQPGTGPG